MTDFNTTIIRIIACFISLYVVRKISMKYGNRLCSIRLLAGKYRYDIIIIIENKNETENRLQYVATSVFVNCAEHYCSLDFCLYRTQTILELIKTTLTIRNIVDKKKFFT